MEYSCSKNAQIGQLERWLKMEKNDIYELTRLMSDKDGLQNELTEMMDILRDTLQKKYVNKIHAAARERKDEAFAHPPKEVTLLRALKAFTNEDSAGQLDNMIQTLLFVNTIRKINEGVSALSSPQPQLLQAMSSGENSDAPTTDQTIVSEHAQATGILLTLALANII